MSIVEIGGVVSAIVVIFSAWYKTFKMCHQVLRKLEDFEETTKRNELHIMKLGLFNEGLPLSERIHCGKRYLELGGNGTGKIQDELLVKKMEDEMDHKYHSYYNG